MVQSVFCEPFFSFIFYWIVWNGLSESMCQNKKWRKSNWMKTEEIKGENMKNVWSCRMESGPWFRSLIPFGLGKRNKKNTQNPLFRNCCFSFQLNPKTWELEIVHKAERDKRSAKLMIFFPFCFIGRIHNSADTAFEKKKKQFPKSDKDSKLIKTQNWNGTRRVIQLDTIRNAFQNR